MAYPTSPTSRRKTSKTGQGGLVVLLSGTLLINLAALGFLGFGDLLKPVPKTTELESGDGVALIDSETPEAQQTYPAPVGGIPADAHTEGIVAYGGQATGDPVEQEVVASPVVERPDTTAIAPIEIAPLVSTLPPVVEPVAIPEEPTTPEPPIEFFGVEID